MGIEIHFIDVNGVDRGPLPDFQTIDISPVDADYGSVNFTYPETGIRYDLMYDAEEFEVAVYIDGVRRPELDAIMKDYEGDDVSEGVTTFTGLMMLTLMDRGRVYPKGWPSYNITDVNHQLPSATAGTIMLNFINLCKARGALSSIVTTSFNAAHDSNGVAWTKAISLEYKPGISMADILKSLQGNGVADFRMEGRELKLYNPDTNNVDLTLLNPPVTFRKGRDINDSPRKRSTRDRVSVVLAAGAEDEGVYHEEADSAAIATYGRIEGYVSNGNIHDVTTLEAYSELELAKIVKARMEKTHGLVFTDPKSPKPILTFDVGDWAFSDVGRGLERLRIKQWVMSQNGNGEITGSVVLNDLFAEATERLSRKIDGILGGSSVTGESQATDNPVPPEVYDGIAPKTPTGLAADSLAFTDSAGQSHATVTATWLPVTQNSDNTPITDLESYFLRYGTAAFNDWNYIVVEPGTTSVSFGPVAPGQPMDIEVAARDKSGNYSAWSALYNLTTSTDDTIPTAPAAPTINNYMGLLEIKWNGAMAAGSLPDDFSYVEVHASTVTNFTPSSATLVGTLRRASSVFIETPYGTTYYAKLIVVDNSGNVGAASAQASGSTAQVVSSDIFAGAVGSAQLADLAVTTAKINLLAVNTAQVGSMDVGKLSAGTMTAVVIIGGRITTALTGARTEMNSAGFYRYDSSGNQVVAIDASGALLTGIYRTALSGRRVEVGQANLGSVRFIGASAGDAIGYVSGRTNGSSALVEFGIESWSNPAASTSGGTWDLVHIVGSTTSGAASAAVYASDSHQFYISDPNTQGGFFGVYADDSRGSTTGAFYSIFNVGSDISFRPYEPGGPAPGNEIIWFTKQGVTQESPRMVFRNTNGYSEMIKFYYNELETPLRNPAIEIRDGNDTAFYAIRAAIFETASDERTKTNIRKSDDDMLEIVKGLKLKRFTRKSAKFHDKDGKELPEHTFPEEIGLIAQETPDLLRGGSGSGGMQTIDLGKMVMAAIGAVQQLAGRLEALEGGEKP